MHFLEKTILGRKSILGYILNLENHFLGEILQWVPSQGCTAPLGFRGDGLWGSEGRADLRATLSKIEEEVRASGLARISARVPVLRGRADDVFD
jgi:hypothetical protein